MGKPRQKKTNTIPAPIHFKQIGEAKTSTNDYNQWLDHNENEVDHDKLHAFFSKSPLNGTDEEKETLGDYQYDSSDLNKHLIKTDNNPTKKQHVKAANNLDSIIDQNRIKFPYYTYSGTSFDPRKYLDKNGQMHSPAYISSSHRKHVANDFAESSVDLGKIKNPEKTGTHMMRFQLNANDPAMYSSHDDVPAYEFMSFMSPEYETTIKRGQTLQYHGTKTYQHPDGYPVHVHTMSIVNNGK
jgi:hypothetical protein